MASNNPISGIASLTVCSEEERRALASLTVTSPLVGEVGSHRRCDPGEGSLSTRPTAFGVRGCNPSSGASRHLLPQGEKDQNDGCPGPAFAKASAGTQARQ